MLADDRRSWLLQPDGHWIRTEVAQSREGTIETFAVLKEDAVAAVAVATDVERARAVRLAGPARVTAPAEAAGKPLEVELKYRMSETAAGDRLLATDELAGMQALEPVETVVHEDRYVDTPDGALEAAGYAGRLRSDGNGSTVITLKGLASPGRRRRPPRADGARGPGGSRDGRGLVAGVGGTGRGPGDRRARRRSWTGCASARSGASACTASTARSWSCRWTTSRCSSATG